MRISTIAIADWPRLAAGRQKQIQIATSVAIWLCMLLSLMLVFLVVLRSPLSAFLALTTGTLVRCLGQRANLNRILRSPKPADLAAFEFDGQGVKCSFDESSIARYTNARKWRIAASIAAGSVCLATRHLPYLGQSLLPASAWSGLWLDRVIETGAALLPVFVAIAFLRINGPERRWTSQVKAAIQARAAASIGKILADHEIDGLEAGTKILWLELGIDRRGEYSSALKKRLRSHTAEAVLQPETAMAMLRAVTELGRLDLESLGAAVAGYRQAECRVGVVQTLAAAFRNPVHEMKAEELGRELERLVLLAGNRQWDDFHKRAGWLEAQLDDLREELGHSASVPAVMLPPGSDPYRLLGISADTPTPLVRKLRLRLAQLYHPDIGDSTGNGAKMAELNAAYDAVMKDREKEGR